MAPGFRSSPLIRDEASTKPKAKSRAEAKRQRLAERERFRRAHRAERQFSTQMRGVAKQVDHIVKAFAPKGQVINWPMLNAALHKYSDMLRPWATQISERMIANVGNRDERAWSSMGRTIGRNLKREILGAPVNAAVRKLMDEQVELITSLPLDAARRVHKLTQEALISGERAKTIQADIMRTGEVTKSSAMLIARTETGRTSSVITQARAKHIGSEGYIWRTAKDHDVRHQHRKLEGKFFSWDDPPVTGPSGERSNPGAIYNCRCYPEVVIPEELS